MDPIVFEVLGSVLAGAMIWLTVLRRPKNTSPAAMPVLAVQKTRTISASHRRRSSPSKRAKSRVASPGSSGQKRRIRTKATEQTIRSTPASTVEPHAITTLETCPSCGLQAPDKLLAEHFLGSPSHRNGPEKIMAVDPIPNETPNETNKTLREDESKQSVRNLLQILVPPRAFGLRHAHRSVSPISSVVQDLGPSRRHQS